MRVTSFLFSIYLILKGITKILALSLKVKSKKKLKFFLKKNKKHTNLNQSTQFKTMSVQMNSTTLTNISLFIPHMFKNFTAEYIAKVFDKLKIGMVDHVDFVPKVDRHGRQYNAAYVHFKHWFDGAIAANFQERVLNPKKEARIVHDDPWYWIVLENTAKKQPTAEEPTVEEPTVEEPTAKEPKWVLLSLEQEKALEAEIEAAWNENYVLKAELKKIREGDDAKINDLRLAIRRLEAQAKKDAEEIYSLEIELSEKMTQVRELENRIQEWEEDTASHSAAIISDHNVMLREKVVELGSLEEKQRNTLIDKQQELIDATRKVVELEEKLKKSNDSVEYLSNAKRDLNSVCRSILSPETVHITDAKDKICQHLYSGLTYWDLMEKPQEDRNGYWEV